MCACVCVRLGEHNSVCVTLTESETDISLTVTVSVYVCVCVLIDTEADISLSSIPLTFQSSFPPRLPLLFSASLCLFLFLVILSVPVSPPSLHPFPSLPPVSLSLSLSLRHFFLSDSSLSNDLI